MKVTLNQTDTVHDSDIEAILKDPWTITQEEFASGGYTLDDARVTMQSCVERATRSNTIRLWRENEHPVLIAGAIAPTATEAFRSFFFASSLFECHGFNLTRQIRRWLHTAQDRYPSASLVAVSRSLHPRRDRWFDALGFTYEPGRTIEGKSVFVFRGRPISAGTL